mmetsp:Transcript_83959/g.271704  ORF Transcript_83959/g.271704 Transcript_83959/m.271704 type:complete len:221 (-) Transcript_83959:143-805(-)
MPRPSVSALLACWRPLQSRSQRPGEEGVTHRRQRSGAKQRSTKGRPRVPRRTWKSCAGSCRLLGEHLHRRQTRQPSGTLNPASTSMRSFRGSRDSRRPRPAMSWTASQPVLASCGRSCDSPCAASSLRNSTSSRALACTRTAITAAAQPRPWCCGYASCRRIADGELEARHAPHARASGIKAGAAACLCAAKSADSGRSCIDGHFSHAGTVLPRKGCWHI